MSGLAHVFEAAGIATVVVALYRLHAEKMRPPRALWVPFELGRPLGAPNDVALQMTTLRAALGLFESAPGPGTLVDLDAEQPDLEDDPSWVNPALSAMHETLGSSARAASLVDEVAALAPCHGKLVSRRGRTTAGLSSLDAGQASVFLEALLVSADTPSPVPGLAPAQVMRYAADDLKAMYLEIATSGPGAPSSRQLGDWLYRETRLGDALHVLRQQSIAGGDDTVRRAVGSTGLVTQEWAG